MIEQSNTIQIQRMQAVHARDAARLHIQGIDRGFISSLGENFVTALYESIVSSSSSFGYAALQGSRVVGFVAFTDNLGRLYRSVVCRGGLRFFFLLSGRLLSFAALRKTMETLFYPKRIEKLDLPSAELLSIVVDASVRGQGVAARLVHAGLEECRQRSLPAVKVLVAAENEKANRLYQKCGFRFKTTIDNHGIKSNIYVIDLDAVSKNLSP